MKLTHAVLILVLSIIVQVSLVRLFISVPFAPNLFLVALFLLCYFLSFEEIMILAIVGGFAIDLSSSVGFGSTSLSALGACSLIFYLRENVLKGERFADFFISSLITFSIFYLLLGTINIFLKSSIDFVAISSLININLAGEILFNFVIGVFGYYLIKKYKNSISYGFNRNIKISS